MKFTKALKKIDTLLKENLNRPNKTEIWTDRKTKKQKEILSFPSRCQTQKVQILEESETKLCITKNDISAIVSEELNIIYPGIRFYVSHDRYNDYNIYVSYLKAEDIDFDEKYQKHIDNLIFITKIKINKKLTDFGMVHEYFAVIGNPMAEHVASSLSYEFDEDFCPIKFVKDFIAGLHEREIMRIKTNEDNATAFIEKLSEYGLTLDQFEELNSLKKKVTNSLQYSY